jgi:hypothetical protein
MLDIIMRDNGCTGACIIRPQTIADLYPARAGNSRFWRLSALRAHTKTP